jgi:hypothetical protein
MSLEDDKLLLAEYAHFTESFLKNEEIGEHRIQFFITVTTAIVGGVVVLLFTSDHVELAKPARDQIAMAALLGNLLFGVVTFWRILHRDKVTDEYKEVIGYLRARLRERSPGLVEYHPPLGLKRHWLLSGGLGVTAAAINSVLAACVVAVWVSVRADAAEWPSALAAFLASFAIHGVALSKRRPNG